MYIKPPKIHYILRKPLLITEGEAAILLEMTQRAFRNKSQSKQRSTLIWSKICLIQLPTCSKFWTPHPQYFNFWGSRNSNFLGTFFRVHLAILAQLSLNKVLCQSNFIFGLFVVMGTKGFYTCFCKKFVTFYDTEKSLWDYLWGLQYKYTIKSAKLQAT